jgi:S1-C subfamily serine protease
MKLSQRTKLLGLFAAMVAVSVATNLTTNLISDKSNRDALFQTNEVPATYTAISKAPRAMDTDFTLAAELSVHAVVHVKTKTPMQMQQGFGGGGFNDPFFEYFFGPQQRRQQQQPQEAPMREGSGSGVIISNDGYIVTNNHVIDKSKEIEVTLNDKRTFKAKLVGADPNTDIALLKIEAEKLPVILFGNSDSLKIGEWVLAVGNPFNLTSTVTAGIVSAKARNINIINSQMKIESFIQTDAAVNPGNSGGALVNTRGELIGINTAIASQTGSYAGYSFAIPTSIVKKVVSDIRQFGFVQRAVLGVSMKEITSEIAKEKNWIRMAATLGAKFCRVLSGQRRPELTRERGLELVAQSIEACLPEAEACGVTLVIENHYKDDFWTYPEFAQKMDVFCELVDKIHHPCFGVNYDPSNAFLAGDDPLELLRRVKHRVLTMHASDRFLIEGTLADLQKEEAGVAGYARRLRHGTIGKGLNDYDTIFRELKSVGFDSWISIEDGVDGMDQLVESIKFVRKKMAQTWPELR